MNDCPPKPGLTDMISTRSSLSSVWSSQSSGVAGLNTRPALQPQSRIRPIVRSTCSEASGWKLTIRRARLGEIRDDAIDRLHHQVDVDRNRRVRPDRRADERPDGQVRNVVVVHHVEVEQVGAGGGHRAHFVAEAREIRGQEGGRNQEIGHGFIIARENVARHQWLNPENTTSRSR